MATNEEKLKNELNKFKIILESKHNALCKYNGKEIRTSVDFFLKDKKNERQLLIEVDSYNMAKVVTGQYILLNQIYRENMGKKFSEFIKFNRFIVVHFYKNYNPERTVKHLDFIYKNLLKSNGIPFSVYSEKTFLELCKEMGNEEKLINSFFI